MGGLVKKVFCCANIAYSKGSVIGNRVIWAGIAGTIGT